MSSSSSHEQLRAQYVGKTLHDVPTPSCVLDLAKLDTNCKQMLDAVHRLGLGWRPHIKTHKTVELTRMQVGDDLDTPADIIVSTLLEAENIIPLMKEYQSRGRKVNILFSFPLFPSAVPRLAAISSALGPNSLSLIIDHPSQLPHVSSILRQQQQQEQEAHPPLLYMKVDMGYARAGVVPHSPACETLIDAMLKLEDAGDCVFHGLYCHAGNSYEAREDWQALDYLAVEFKAIQEVAASVQKRRPGHPLTLSVGATPTATAVQHPDLLPSSTTSDASVSSIKTYINDLQTQGFHLEVHAGVYPTLDLQQLATHARDHSLMSISSLAITVLCEVASLYPGRNATNGTTEALIDAGCLALGREPCADMRTSPEEKKPYSGWGIVMPWNGLDNPVPGKQFPAEHGGWQVGKVSQEHGILRWFGETGEKELPLEYGQRVRIWPNHACIAGSGFSEYFIVDSRRQGKEDEIVDIWQRWRGW